KPMARSDLRSPSKSPEARTAPKPALGCVVPVPKMEPSETACKVKLWVETILLRMKTAPAPAEPFTVRPGTPMARSELPSASKSPELNAAPQASLSLWLPTVSTQQVLKKSELPVLSDARPLLRPQTMTIAPCPRVWVRSCAV